MILSSFAYYGKLTEHVSHELGQVIQLAGSSCLGQTCHHGIVSLSREGTIGCLLKIYYEDNPNFKSKKLCRIFKNMLRNRVFQIEVLSNKVLDTKIAEIIFEYSRNISITDKTLSYKTLLQIK